MSSRGNLLEAFGLASCATPPDLKPFKAERLLEKPQRDDDRDNALGLTEQQDTLRGNDAL
jgi:hypothetical protein